MDTGRGEMAELSEKVATKLEAAGMPVFKEGDEFLIKGSMFRLRTIGKKYILLELLPQ